MSNQPTKTKSENRAHTSTCDVLGGRTGSAISPWDFAVNWYPQEDIERFQLRQQEGLIKMDDQIPEDVYSKEFAAWMTCQYRLAMNKGIELGQKWFSQKTESSRT